MITSHFGRLRYRAILKEFAGFILLIAISNSTNGQYLKSNTTVDNQDSIYYELFKENRTSDLSKAKFYASRTLAISLTYHHTEYTTKSLNALAFLCEVENQFDSAYYYYKAGFDVALQNNLISRVVYLSNNLGRLFERQDMYDSALYYFSISFSKAHELNLYLDESIAIHNIAMVNYSLENFGYAIEKLKQDIELRKAHKIAEGLDRSFINLALIYCDINRLDDSRESLIHAEAICKPNCDNYVASSISYVKALLNMRSGDTIAASRYFQECINLGSLGNNLQKVANAYYHQSYLCNEIDSSIDKLLISKGIAIELKHRRLLKDIYNRISELYLYKNLQDSSEYYHNLCIEIKDSIFNKTIANNIKELELASQRRESALVINEKEEQVEQSQLVSILIAIISLLLLTIVSLVIRSLMAGKRHKKTLENAVLKKTLELEDMNKELSRSHLEYNYLVYRTSRDIRAPLATLMGLINISHAHCNEADWRKHVNRVKHELDIKLDQLTELYEMRDQQVTFQEISIDSLVTDIHTAFAKESKFPVASVIINKEVPHQISTDKNLMENLILCTARYFTQGLHDLIAIDFDYNEDGLIIAIAGELIPSKTIEQENLFDLFLAQIAAWKLEGRLMLSESENGLRCQIVIPQRYTVTQTLNELELSHSQTA